MIAFEWFRYDLIFNISELRSSIILMQIVPVKQVPPMELFVNI